MQKWEHRQRAQVCRAGGICLREPENQWGTHTRVYTQPHSVAVTFRPHTETQEIPGQVFLELMCTNSCCLQLLGWGSLPHGCCKQQCGQGLGFITWPRSARNLLGLGVRECCWLVSNREPLARAAQYLGLGSVGLSDTHQWLVRPACGTNSAPGNCLPLGTISCLSCLPFLPLLAADCGGHPVLARKSRRGPEAVWALGAGWGGGLGRLPGGGGMH